MVQINWTNIAITDLKDIADYIKKDSDYYAKIQVVRLKKRVEILKKQPLIGSIVPEFNRNDLRQLICGNYRIIYKIKSEKNIDILSVHHTSRDLISRKIIN